MDERQLRHIADRALEEDLSLVAEKTHDGDYRNQVVNHIVFFIPGIRDQGNRSDIVTHTLEKEIPTVRVVPIKYDGHFGAIRLFNSFSRKRRRKIVADKIAPVLSDNSIHRVSFIAHSFGTYLLAESISKLKSTKWHRIILCGSIVNRKFDWSTFTSSINNSEIIVLNDCGTRDNWPVYAESLSDKFSSTGVYGFGGYGVFDRTHSVKHDGYINEEFIRDYWIDFIKSGLVKKGQDEKPENHFHNLLVKPILRLKHSLPLIIVFLTCAIMYFLLQE
ncbi:MAG: hypothetical protein AB2598_20065 [Candidatus Thiodiazotropha sp.]